MLKRKLLIIIPSVVVLFIAGFAGFLFNNNLLSLGPEKSSIDVRRDIPDPSIKIQIDDDISISVGIANECVGAICCLAGFEEYNDSPNPYLPIFKNYLNKYKNNKKVKKAIRHYKKLREFGFSYDAPPRFATYVTPDCHHWRTDYETVKKECNSRNELTKYNSFGNLDKLLKVTADFYDAVDFEKFYKTNRPIFNSLLMSIGKNSDCLKTISSCFKDYFHHGAEGTVLNFSVYQGNGNYGTHFEEGGKSFFEPKYSSIDQELLYYNIYVIIHELCHPESNLMADKLLKNPQIEAYLTRYLTGDKKNQLNSSNYYPANAVYFNELLTRANTIRILSKFMDEEYVNDVCIRADIDQGYENSAETAKLMEEYENGNYATFADYEERLTELFIDKFCNE